MLLQPRWGAVPSRKKAGHVPPGRLKSTKITIICIVYCHDYFLDIEHSFKQGAHDTAHYTAALERREREKEREGGRERVRQRAKESSREGCDGIIQSAY